MAVERHPPFGVDLVAILVVISRRVTGSSSERQRPNFH